MKLNDQIDDEEIHHSARDTDERHGSWLNITIITVPPSSFMDCSLAFLLLGRPDPGIDRVHLDGPSLHRLHLLPAPCIQSAPPSVLPL